MRLLELKIPPPFVALLVGVAMWFAARFGPSLELPVWVRAAAFVAIGLTGAATAVSGNLQFKRAGTTISPLKPGDASVLVTSGVFRFTRNPMYLGLALVLLGYAAFLCSALALAGPVAFVLYIGRFQIAPEERILRAKFGEAFAAYASRVGRWV